MVFDWLPIRPYIWMYSLAICIHARQPVTIHMMVSDAPMNSAPLLWSYQADPAHASGLSSIDELTWILAASMPPSLDSASATFVIASA